LFTALLSAFRVKKESVWRTFDFGGPKRHDDNVGILRRMDQDLRKAGFLQPFSIYLDDTVHPDSQKEALTKIARQFGATVVTDATLATHVVAHDDETDHDDLIQAEQALETTGQPMDKLYLRTVAHDQETGTKALVHWWFWPASYDEWMPAADVSGAAPEDHHPPQPGPWVVSCRFLRDVARYNEWGVEADYTIQN
jgi:SWI/SNF related-matrix-associated actin-dependent regulator of chromatin subfamily C